MKSQIGRGAFGVVWLAEETTCLTTHKVALKLPSDAEVNIETIRQEAVLWEQVKGHPNILPIIKADVVKNQIYIASEYAPDGSLADWIRKNHGCAPTPFAAIEMTKGILAGLAHLHSKSVIHRDLKPENILLQGEIPRIADFGIARMLKDSQSLKVAGTPNYMAPEGFDGVRSEQTDIWAVGVIFYQLMTGLLPYPQADFLSMVKAIVYEEPQIDKQKLPEHLYFIINKALQKDASNRYRSVSLMLDDLRKFNSMVFESNFTADTIPDSKFPTGKSSTPALQTTQKTEIMEETLQMEQLDTNAEKNRETLLLEIAPDTVGIRKDKSYLQWAGGILAIAAISGAAYIGISYSKISPADSQAANTKAANTNVVVLKDDIYNRSLWAEWALMLENDEYEKIVRETTAEIERNPTNFIAYRMRATAYDNLGNSEAARMDTREVLRLSTNPTTAEEYESRCYSLRIINKPDEALTNCTKAIELDSQLALAYNIRGTIYHQKQMLDLAVAEYSKAIELSPRKTFFQNRALAYRALGNKKLAAIDDQEVANLEKYRTPVPSATVDPKTSSKSSTSENPVPKPSIKVKPTPNPKVSEPSNTRNSNSVFIFRPKPQSKRSTVTKPDPTPKSTPPK